MTTINTARLQERLAPFKGRFPEICDRFDIGYSWLTKFHQGVRGTRPSFDLITKLNGALDTLEAEAMGESEASTTHP